MGESFCGLLSEATLCAGVCFAMSGCFLQRQDTLKDFVTAWDNLCVIALCVLHRKWKGSVFRVLVQDIMLGMVAKGQCSVEIITVGFTCEVSKLAVFTEVLVLNMRFCVQFPAVATALLCTTQ